MPMRLELYPPDWNEIARSIKDACDWECQQCGLQCRRPGEAFDTHRRTLTVAHLCPEDHAPDAPIVFVAALCARCHLQADAQRKAQARSIVAAMRRQAEQANSQLLPDSSGSN